MPNGGSTVDACDFAGIFGDDPTQGHPDVVSRRASRECVLLVVDDLLLQPLPHLNEFDGGFVVFVVLDQEVYVVFSGVGVVCDIALQDPFDRGGTVDAFDPEDVGVPHKVVLSGGQGLEGSIEAVTRSCEQLLSTDKLRVFQPDRGHLRSFHSVLPSA
jgi:hypothetical protein